MKVLRDSASAGFIAAMTGILFLVLVLAAPEPGAGSAGQSLFLAGLAWVCFIAFAAALRHETLAREGAGRGVADVLFAAAALVAAFGLMSTAIWVAPLLTGGIEEALGAGADAAAIGLWRFFAEATANVLIEAGTFWRGLMLIGVAVAALRVGILPLWLAWISAALGATALIASIAFLDSPFGEVATMLGFGSSVAFYFWVPLTGLSLAWRTRSRRVDAHLTVTEHSTTTSAG